LLPGGFQSYRGEATTSSQSAFFVRVPAANLRRTRVGPKALGNTNQGNSSRRMGGVSPLEIRKVKDHAFNSTPGSWLVNRFIPMQSSIKSILNGVVVIAVVLWLLNVFGLFHSLNGIRLGKG
jgi:hypothetical protein